MTTTGDVAKGFLIFFCGYFLLIAIEQALIGQGVLAAFMLVGFATPLTYVICGYVKDRSKKKPAA